MTTDPEALNVVVIGDFTVYRKRAYERARQKDCEHAHLQLDDKGATVTCTDCGKQVSAYWALCQMATAICQTLRDARREREQVAWERKKTVRLRAAKAFEEVWRRHMLPCCPHCDAGILPEEALRLGEVHPDLERQRRAAREATP